MAQARRLVIDAGRLANFDYASGRNVSKRLAFAKRMFGNAAIGLRGFGRYAGAVAPCRAPAMVDSRYAPTPTWSAMRCLRATGQECAPNAAFRCDECVLATRSGLLRTRLYALPIGRIERARAQTLNRADFMAWVKLTDRGIAHRAWGADQGRNARNRRG